VIALSIQEKVSDPKIDPFAQIAKFRKAHGVTYPILSDEKATVIRKFGFQVIPANVIIDKNGKYRANPDSVDEVVAAVQKLNK
jgi:peroxiredoxin